MAASPHNMAAGPYEVRLPSLAESVVEGEILGWLVAEGDTVQEGQPMAEVMTDKVTVELPSPVAGRVGRLLVKAGDVVPVGGVLALVHVAEVYVAEVGVAEPASAAPAAPVPVAPTLTAPAQPAQAAASGLQEERSIIESASVKAEDLSLVAAVFAGFKLETPRPQTHEPQTPGQPAGSPRVLAVPSARRLARQHGVALQEVQGSGPNGAVRQADVTAHVGSRTAVGRAEAEPTLPSSPSGWPPPPPASYRTPAGHEELETRTPFRGQRRAISQALLASTLYTAQTHTIAELDCSALIRLRQELRPEAEAAGVRLSYLPFFLKAVAVALGEYPALNSSLDTAAGEIVSKRYVNLGVAVNTDAGLIVPVVRGVTHMSLLTLARGTADLSERARLGTLKPAETQDATFTVSNIGAVGALVGVPLVIPPAVGILSLHSIVKRPIAIEVNGEDVVAVRPMMYLTLGFDHRLVDGADAARFNLLVVQLLEHPARLLFQTEHLRLG